MDKLTSYDRTPLFVSSLLFIFSLCCFPRMEDIQVQIQGQYLFIQIIINFVRIMHNCGFSKLGITKFGLRVILIRGKVRERKGKEKKKWSCGVQLEGKKNKKTKARDA